MYFVDRKKIEDTVKFVEDLVSMFEGHQQWESDVEKKALERIAQLLIEAILDIGNGIIDGFIMRDPGSYEDIIDILEDESVVDSRDAEGLKKLISYRKMLVQDYLNIRHEELYDSISTHLQVLRNFCHRVRTYLEDELGPVTAFKP
ncbi:MAG: DUF86 domain-containing protein [Bacillaceae bacterium]|jgi:Uncharacterized conserved protein|uniref:DUF86 domain-containing protein n=2 Tax=Aeribacillus TaxID=1055323 RepID=A0A223E545_9BACI|nr:MULTISPECIES: DUF86 domain-containing protein [Aeribacillus]AXI39300.1 DUF86 domain-containing protein [Bacillaceae bacterium ZC4]REJ18719.1 MAG: DUF86 domain-containing protein [Bacillaceae bacterium]ASS90356.1 hypothetical protein AP3564_09035 [Aeribacillus pallidus]MDR9792003.1 DUF86 domain-containing protein [Aeribacillus pallidus]MDR9797731.1 DUF86 domain-containing protein [Aeribacillus pallidus]